MVQGTLIEATVQSASSPRAVMVDGRFATVSVKGNLAEAMFATAQAKGKLVDAAVLTANPKGKLVDAAMLTVNPKGKLVDALIASSYPTGRLVDAQVETMPPIVGYLGLGGSWVPMRGYLPLGGAWTPVKRWIGEQPITPPDPPDPEPGATRGPIEFSSVAEARAFLNAPSDANYVVWDDAWTAQNLMLHEVCTTKLSPNDILVLPQRVDGQGNAIPYLMDTQYGFMATGVASITGALPNDTAGSRVPIVSNSRCWFEFVRARRGILGMGPKSVIAPSVSAFRRPAQPITEQTGGTMAAYNAAGAKLQNLVGAQDTMITFDHADPWTANFELRGADFGGVAYSGIATRFAKNLLLNAASRGHAGVPNGESGSIRTNNGSYEYENIEIITTDSTGTRVVTSPIMWNRTTGGTMRNVHTGRPNFGMFTLWRCDGTNTWTNVAVQGNDVSLNLEEGGAAFVLNWSGGSISTAGNYHIVGESSGGSKKITLAGVAVYGGRDASINALAAHFYSYTGQYTQKLSDITRVNPAGTVRGYAFML